MKRLNVKGFTIIELLIATVVFSLVLLIVTAATLQISRIYYKGVTDSKTQEVARSVVDDIAKKIQYTKGSPTPVSVTGLTAPNGGAYCIAGTLYKYRKLQSVPGAHALVYNDSCASTTGLFVAGDKELLADNMHIRDFSITNSGLTSTITIIIGYGNPGSAPAYNNGDFASSGPTQPCRFSIARGGQFCSTASYKTTITKRRD